MVPRNGTHVPLVLCGVLVDGEPRYALEIPSGASLLVGYSPGTRIAGLSAIPPGVRPPDHLVTTVHLAFDVMVGIGFALLALALWFAVLWWRRRVVPENRWFLRAVAVSGALTVVALEAGWIVTEVGRQPWTVVGYLLTREAVTTSGNVWLFFTATLLLYAAVAVGTFMVLGLLRRRWRGGGADADAGDVPYGPSRAGEPVDVSAAPR